MIKVAFWYDRPQEYTGGLNYFRNLLFALSQLEYRTIEPYIFFGKKVNGDILRSFQGLATVVQTSVLDRKSLTWYMHKVLFRVFGSLAIVQFQLWRHEISILSHAQDIHGSARHFRVISWIPDFQYLHLPELFPNLNIVKESNRMREIAEQTDVLILSSHAALEDYRSIVHPAKVSKVVVLPFVSQPSNAITYEKEEEGVQKSNLEVKFKFAGRYFYLPNQFWRHKNHAVVFSAVKMLKACGVETLLLCSGNLQDYRLKGHAYVDELVEFIKSNGLSENIKILGVIDYAEVLALMRNCVAVLNPSKFEGWSSTVEEARSMGQRLIVTNIPVHLEQNPPRAKYFEPDDAVALSLLMKEVWECNLDGVSNQDKLEAGSELHLRTQEYAKNYTKIVLGLASSQALSPHN